MRDTEDFERLKIDLLDYKKQVNCFRAENVKLKTNNEQLKKEIGNNEKVIEQIMG